MYSEEEEDPVERYKREFKRKRWEKEQAWKEKMERSRKLTHRFFRYLSFSAALFSTILLFDKYLPGNIYKEIVEQGWQQRGARSKYGRGVLYSYMETEHFIIEVPSQIHVNYPYYDGYKPPLTITVSPIFKIPRYAVVVLGDSQYSFTIGDTILAMWPLVWSLLISSLLVILIKDYSWYTYCFSYVPIILLLMTLLKMFW